MSKIKSQYLWQKNQTNLLNRLQMQVRTFLKNIATAAVAVCSIATLNAQTYNWKQVVIKGGGYVPGLVYSKADPSLLYARTDVGGAYRWNAADKTWIPITDMLTDGNDWGVWSIAPDPVNADRVYIATGLYSESWGAQGILYRSDNRGASWSKLATLPCKLGGNNPGRGTCEHLAVDPNKNSILFLGSKKDGLLTSTDGGLTWSAVTSLGASYITFVEFDKTSGTTGNATQNIYVGVADYIYNNGPVGIYRSTNGGSTWSKLANHPAALKPKGASLAPGDIALATVPTKMVFTAGSTIYISFCNSVTPDGDGNASANYKAVTNGAVYKYNKSTNVWTDITPSDQSDKQGGFSSIAVHPTDANKIAVTTIARWWPHDEVYFSADGGANWSSTFNSYGYAPTWGASLNKGTMSYTKAAWGAAANLGWPNSIIFNPANGNEVMFGSGGGVYACYDVSGLFTNATPANTAATTWVYENDGLEETCAIELISPPTGAPLLSAIGDVDGFMHSDLDKAPKQRLLVGAKTAGSNRSIAFAEKLPSKMVKTHDDNEQNKGAYSTDGGATWTKFTARPSGVGQWDNCGKICISADGNTIVWASANVQIAYSTNNGGSWTNCNGGIPNGLKPVADRVNSSKFYVFDPQSQTIYYSTDGGKNFSSKSLGLNPIPQYEALQSQLCAVFGNEGHLWLADIKNGLHRSTNSGTSFTKIANVEEAYNVTVGKAAPSGTYPSIFIWGVINKISGLYRSDDQGATWVKLNDADHEYARNFACMAGDPRVYGRLYVAPGGRGIVYGDIAAVPCSAAALGTDTAVCPGETIVLNSGITDAGYTFAWTKDGAAFAGSAAKLTVADNGLYRVTATKTGCPASSSTVSVSTCTRKQTIDLKQGWNLISINVLPADNTISSLFSGLNVSEIKTMNTFWRNDQAQFLNRLKTITPGEGYLVNMTAAGTVTITGTPMNTSVPNPLPASNWQLIGCPYQSGKPMTDVFGSNFLIIKDFNGFNTPGVSQNSLDNIEPGKAYFLQR